MNRICKCIATDFIDLVLDLTMIFMSSIHVYAFQILLLFHFKSTFVTISNADITLLIHSLK